MTTLFIVAEPVAGSDIRDAVLPAMVRLARTTDCAVEVRGNETRFVAYPTDSIGALQAAYDRLYPASAYVSVATVNPMPRATARRFQVRHFTGFHRNGWRVMDTKHTRWAVPRTIHESSAQAQVQADELNAADKG